MLSQWESRLWCDRLSPSRMSRALLAHIHRQLSCLPCFLSGSRQDLPSSYWDLFICKEDNLYCLKYWNSQKRIVYTWQLWIVSVIGHREGGKQRIVSHGMPGEVCSPLSRWTRTCSGERKKGFRGLAQRAWRRLLLLEDRIVIKGYWISHWGNLQMRCLYRAYCLLLNIIHAPSIDFGIGCA